MTSVISISLAEAATGAEWGVMLAVPVAVLLLAGLVMCLLGGLIKVLRTVTELFIPFGVLMAVYGLWVNQYQLCAIGALVVLCCIPVRMVVMLGTRKR